MDTQSMVGQHLVNSQKIAVRYIGQVSADSQSIYRSRVLSVCIVFSPLSIALEKKLEQNYWNMNRLPSLTYGDSWKIRIFGHFSHDTSNKWCLCSKGKPLDSPAILTLDWYSNDSWPIYHRQLTDIPPTVDRYITHKWLIVSRGASSRYQPSSGR